MFRNYFYVRRKQRFILVFIGFLTGLITFWLTFGYFFGRVKPSVPMGLRVNIWEPGAEDIFDGPGELGSSCLFDSTIKVFTMYEKSLQEFQKICSGVISLDRSLKDSRDQQCKYWQYPEKLPTVSVIIVYHNEIRTVLLRTIHSIRNRTPRKLLREIILVDDYSDQEDLLRLRNDLLGFRGTIKLIRNDKFKGEVISRNIGANLSTGEVLVFLNSRCEVNINWLPPLLVPLMDIGYAATAPLEDIINFRTFKYILPYFEPIYKRGEFTWDFSYIEMDTPKQELNSRYYKTQPYKSPLIKNFFAIKKVDFLKFPYDESIPSLGLANIDLSLKLWLCLSTIVWVPCSKVGHVEKPKIFDQSMPINPEDIELAKKRIVENWFDHQTKLQFYTNQPIVAILKIKDQQINKCQHTFPWYLKINSMDNLKTNSKLAATVKFGPIKNPMTNMCVQSSNLHPFYEVILRDCQKFNNYQLFRLNSIGNLIVNGYCLHVGPNKLLMTNLCYDHDSIVHQKGWDYNGLTGQIKNIEYSECLDMNDYRELKLAPCETFNSYQQWVFSISTYLGRKLH